LGEVINERKLKLQRDRAGLRIGDTRHVDLVRYVAWLVQMRHAPKPVAESVAPPATALAEAAEGAAKLGSRCHQAVGKGEKLTSKQEAVIAALLTEPSCAAAAAKAGVGKTTLLRWMQRPAFRAAYHRARLELAESTKGRLQAATGQAVETLLAVARDGRRDSDRVRAASALLHHALRGVSDVGALHRAQETVETGSMDSGDVVQMLSDRLRQLDVAELPTGEKARLTATLADALLRAIGVNVLDQRLQALQAVLLGRQEKE
jgi:hypothetical protein